MDRSTILKELTPLHDFFVGIDSDGCVFDTMEVKQKEFFIPNAIKYFNLFPVAKLLRETWEFVNLYSVFRGGNRFISIIKVFELLAGRDEIKRSGVKLPDMTSLKEWVKDETKLGNATLKKYFESNYDPDLKNVTLWSDAVNYEIGEWLHSIPPFPNAAEALRKISHFADAIVVSQTPLDALEREWDEHRLKQYVRIIAGQEHGTKSEHIAFAASGKYPDEKILMIGDAMGDLDAAKNNRILFFPVIPGKEGQSWERFLNEGLDKFISGKFRGRYQESLFTEFIKALPDTPPWKRKK